ncbi:hypothetical protein LTR37_003049 [Vermiconidia calcicola]|uniref:Uncharacterized protein n=1 Tax=Vermiconidia calcicola TaxID=1690605 RepID=A0ACC3NR49_9PEZI|nr:hypothetical protein LTR37_003049 [Vermiconidia calcicola]
MSASVNVPTDPKVRDKDINSKLQLYGIYAAFAQGKVPSNKQIDVAMNSALAWGPMNKPSSKLSSEGQHLVADLRDVIEKTKVMLLTKNDGNLLQDFIWQTQGMGAHNAPGKPNAPIGKDQARQHGQEAVEGLRTLGTLLITNGQFRKLLNDATILLRDMAGDAASKAATKVNPSEDQLNQIDAAAEDNTWHEKPDVGGMKQNLRSQMPIGKKDLKDAANAGSGDATQSAHPGGSRDPADAAQRAGEQGSQSVDAQQGARTGAQTARNRLNERFDEDQKEKARQYREKTRNYFKEKVPKDRRDNVVFRLKKMVVEVQSHRDYQQAIETLLRMAEEYTGHAKDMGAQTQNSAKGAANQEGLKTVETDLRLILERFANNTSFDDLFDAINQIYRDADKDPELKNFFKNMNRYIRRCLQEEGYILDDQANEEWNVLYDQGNFLLRERYRNHTNRLMDEVKFLAGQFEEDKQNTAFARSIEKLFQDLGNDQDGKPQFKPHLLKDLSEVLIPGLFEHIRYVPIPRIEYSDHMIDAVVENLVIEGDNLAPNSMEFGSDNYWKWGRKGTASKNKNKAMLSVSGIQMDLRDVAYYVKKKEGFPGITDKGVMDIFLGGTGLGFKVSMETADKSDKNHFFKINSVVVDIKNLNIKLKQSNHKLLFALVKPLLLKVMKPVIMKVVEKQLRDNVEKLDAMLYRVKQEADRAKEEAKHNPDPEHVQNMYQQYFNAFQREMQKGQEKKQKAEESSGKVNVAVTQQDSMFKNISLPGGTSTKATEYKQLADKGDKWESPVFSIGSAGESRNIPPAGKPQRKPHNATSAELKPKSGGNASAPSYGSQPGGDYGNDGTGYGNNSGAGYGNNTGSGYGNATGTGYTGNTGTNYGSNTGGTQYGTVAPQHGDLNYR